MEIVPMTLREANAFVEQDHRHGELWATSSPSGCRTVTRSWASLSWSVLCPGTCKAAGDLHPGKRERDKPKGSGLEMCGAGWQPVLDKKAPPNG